MVCRKGTEKNENRCKGMKNKGKSNKKSRLKMGILKNLSNGAFTLVKGLKIDRKEVEG